METRSHLDWGVRPNQNVLRLKRVKRPITVLLCSAAGAMMSLGCSTAERPSSSSASFELIAHRGVHPYYYGEGQLDRQTGCSATLLREIEPSLIENTVPSIEAAFDAGATMIEIDIHRTLDGHLVVFHDAGLECRTNGSGAPEDHTLATLKQLDAGFGYTADGLTFPLRGRGVGLIPSLREVLDAFPDGRFLLDDKARSSALIAEVLSEYSESRQANTLYWGPESGYQGIRAQAPSVGPRVMPRADMLACRKPYRRWLAFASLPPECRSAILIVPASVLRPWYAALALGRAQRAGIQIIATTDSVEEAAALRLKGIYGIMTDRIQLLGPALQSP